MLSVSGPGLDRPPDTGAEDPAYLIYASGATGPPKGALHAHRFLFGRLPGFESFYEFAPRSGDVIWTPADWAWMGGLMDVLIPAWYHGITVLTFEDDFDPGGAFELMAEQWVTLAFLPPTALKMMRGSGASRPDLSLRAIFTGGEPLGSEMLEWANRTLGCHINEGYGQTEANLVIGNCASVWPIRPGSMGRALPGHKVVIQDAPGQPADWPRGGDLRPVSRPGDDARLLEPAERHGSQVPGRMASNRGLGNRGLRWLPVVPQPQG